MAGCPSDRVGFHGGLSIPFGQVTVRVFQSMENWALLNPGCSAALVSGRTGPTSAMPKSCSLEAMAAGVVYPASR